MKHNIFYFLFVCMLMGMVACAPSKPSGVISHGDMADILYDMHVAQVMYEANNEKDIVALRASVLKKHDVTQEEWDTSFEYYCRNADELHDIYLQLNERIQANVVALGGKVDGMQGEEADTANVWNAEPDFILMQQAPFNVLSYNIVPDSTFQDGDRLTLQFDVKFIFQDGSRDVVAMMAVYYDNDSVATSITHVSMDGHGIATINNDVQRLHVKQIRGYFMLGKNLSYETSERNQTTIRLAAVQNVKLLHNHTLPPDKPKTTERPDSLAVDSLKPGEAPKPGEPVKPGVTLKPGENVKTKEPHIIKLQK